MDAGIMRNQTMDNEEVIILYSVFVYNTTKLILGRLHMRIISIFIFLIVLHGCGVAPKFSIDVDSISAPNLASGNDYVLMPGNDGAKESDLQYREFSNYVNRALRLQGYRQANNIHKADIAILLRYGIGDPKTEHYTYSLPTWGQTGVSSSSTYGTVTTYGNNANYSGTTTYTPTYGITGSTTHSGTRTSFFRFMQLAAVDLHEYKKTDKIIPIWITTVTSSGSSGDLRQVFPVLVAASMPYIGNNTGKKVRVNILESDKQVNKIKGIQTK